MIIPIKRTSPDIALPEYQTSGAAGFDFAASETVEIPAQSFTLIPTGLTIKIPEGFFLMITARSSLARKKNLMLANGVGIIDSDYCGNDDHIYISVYNPTNHTVIIEKNERIANGIFISTTQATWQEVDAMPDKNRGGFGSTG